MRMRRLSVPLATLVLAACAQSPQARPPASQPAPAQAPVTSPPATPAPAPAPASVAGAYDFSTSVQGQEVTGTVSITQDGGRYGGSIVTTATPDVLIKSVTTEGQTITVTADTPDGEVMIQMTMQGMEFTGSWSYAGQSGTLRGRKRG